MITGLPGQDQNGIGNKVARRVSPSVKQAFVAQEPTLKRAPFKVHRIIQPRSTIQDGQVSCVIEFTL